jgi:hypothetical protein
MKWIVDFHRNWFIEQHSGCLSLLKKPLQPDLGLLRVEGHLIGTTHTIFFNLGFNEDNLQIPQKDIGQEISDLLRDTGYELGEYVRLISDYIFFKFNTDPQNWVYDLSDMTPQGKEMKSERFYKNILNGAISIQINAFLVLFHVTINYLRYVFKNLVNVNSFTWFKIKYVTVYQLVNSLNNLQKSYYQTGELSTQSKAQLRKILSDRDMKRIRPQSNFRNILVHYKLEDVPDNILDTSVPLFGLVEHFYGLTFEQLSIILDDQIDRIISVFDSWTASE